jgi:hypothetical protein
VFLEDNKMVVADTLATHRIMFGTEPWGYGGYGQFHVVIWIILAIAVVVGVVWRLRSGS